MPVTVELIKQGRVALQTYSDPLDMAHMDALKRTMNEDILANSTAKIHVIADLRLLRNLPGMILSRGTFMLDHAHPNTGMIIAVIESTLVARMARIFDSLTPRQSFRVARSYDDAMQIVDEILSGER